MNATHNRYGPRISIAAGLVAAASGYCCLTASAQILNDPLVPPADQQAADAGVNPHAADKDSRTNHPDGILLDTDENDALILTVAGSPRSAVVDYLTSEEGIAVEWRNATFANQAIRGRFTGTLDEIIRRLLDRSNFVITYADDGQTRRISRITILGADPPMFSPAQTPPPRLTAGTPRSTSQTPQAQLEAKALQRRKADEIARRRQQIAR